MSGNILLIDFILKTNININQTNKKNKTALIYSINEKNLEILNLILKYNPILYYNNISSLLISIEDSIPQIYYKLIDYGANLFEMNSEVSIFFSLLLIIEHLYILLVF